MASSYGALCSDFYVNTKLGLKMDLPEERQTVLDLFERIKKENPLMNRLRRYRGEFALESGEDEGKTQWLALRRNTIRAGIVNPPEVDDAGKIHRSIFAVAPYFLSMTALDIDYLEVLFGFDFEADGNHNKIVYDALYAGTPLGAMIDPDATPPLDIQPFLGVGLNESMELQAYFEVKTRTTARQIRQGDFGDEPISVYLTLRQYSPVDNIDELPAAYDALVNEAERLAHTRVIPGLIAPLREAIASARF
jgi:hypothetical protein